MTPEDAVDLGRRVGRSVCRFGPWVDDVCQAATVAAWLHPDAPASAAWCGAVDELRRLTHHDRRGNYRITEVVSLPDDGQSWGGVAEDTYDLGADVDLTPTQARVLTLIGLGFRKADVARMVGVTDSAISHTLRLVRAKYDGREAA